MNFQVGVVTFGLDYFGEVGLNLNQKARGTKKNPLIKKNLRQKDRISSS